MCLCERCGKELDGDTSNFVYDRYGNEEVVCEQCHVNILALFPYMEAKAEETELERYCEEGKEYNNPFFYY